MQGCCSTTDREKSCQADGEVRAFSTQHHQSHKSEKKWWCVLLPTNPQTITNFCPAYAALHFGKTALQQQQQHSTAQTCEATLSILFENTFVFHRSKFLFASYKRNRLSQTSARLRVTAFPSHLGVKKDLCYCSVDCARRR